MRQSRSSRKRRKGMKRRTNSVKGDSVGVRSVNSKALIERVPDEQTLGPERVRLDLGGV